MLKCVQGDPSVKLLMFCFAACFNVLHQELTSKMGLNICSKRGTEWFQNKLYVSFEKGLCFGLHCGNRNGIWNRWEETGAGERSSEYVGNFNKK